MKSRIIKVKDTCSRLDPARVASSTPRGSAYASYNKIGILGISFSGLPGIESSVTLPLTYNLHTDDHSPHLCKLRLDDGGCIHVYMDIEDPDHIIKSITRGILNNTLKLTPNMKSYALVDFVYRGQQYSCKRFYSCGLPSDNSIVHNLSSDFAMSFIRDRADGSFEDAPADTFTSAFLANSDNYVQTFVNYGEGSVGIKLTTEEIAGPDGRPIRDAFGRTIVKSEVIVYNNMLLV